MGGRQSARAVAGRLWAVGKFLGEWRRNMAVAESMNHGGGKLASISPFHFRGCEMVASARNVRQ